MFGNTTRDTIGELLGVEEATGGVEVEVGGVDVAVGGVELAVGGVDVAADGLTDRVCTSIGA